MVYTRSAFNQDQERQLRTLSSLRLNHFIFIRRVNRMDPITPYSEKIDLRTEHGRKIYEACTKAIPVVFDAVAGKHHSFVTVLRNTADERCWREICLVPIGTPPVTYDILIHPGKITMTDLQTHCANIWSGTDADKVQKQIRVNMMGVCLLNSVSESVTQRLEADKEKWFFQNRGGKDGLLIFKLLMQYSLQTTRYGAETTKDKLHSLNIKDFGNNVELMLLHRKTLLDDLQAQGETFNDDLFWAFKCLETVDVPDSFKRYIEDKKSEWEEGLNVTAPELCKAAQTKFKHLLEAGKWKLPTNSIVIEPKESKEKKDAKFIALVAAIKELAKNVSKSNTSSNSESQKGKWKFEAPESGNGTEKEVNSKTYWWCDGGVSKNHKPMYCRHKPAECKKQTPMSTSDAKPAPKSSSNESKGEPKLKINNNLATALAALDKVLQTSTNSDEEEEQDFS
jgi:hypothetical protein